MNFLELFGGGGGVGCGLQAAGHHVITTIEKEPDIADCYQANHPDTKVIVADVLDVEHNLVQIPGNIDALWASPVCKQHSKARRKTLEAREDANIGLAILPYVEAIQPSLVVIENVKGYLKHSSLSTIVATLLKWGYTVSMRTLDAADFGVPQHRERLIVQARRGPIAWPNHASMRRTWYDALTDLFDSMEHADFANWQRQLWRPEYDAILPVMVYGHYDFRDTVDEPKQLAISTADKPACTVTSSHNNTHRRIVLADGRILRVSPRENARLQTFPDGYIFPSQVTLAQEIIGNAVPALMVQRLTELYADTNLNLIEGEVA